MASPAFGLTKMGHLLRDKGGHQVEVNRAAITNHPSNSRSDPYCTSINLLPHKRVTSDRFKFHRPHPRTILRNHQGAPKTSEIEKSSHMPRNQSHPPHVQRLDPKAPIPSRLTDHLPNKKMNTPSLLMRVPNKAPKKLLGLKKASFRNSYMRE